MSESLIKVTELSKKFCKDLRTSLWYGVTDIANELLVRGQAGHDQLRSKEFWAVKDVDFELKRGECLGLIGHNGAGKSTLLKMLNGLIKPDTGRIEIKGRVGALIELGAGFNPILTGRENIYVNGSVLGFTRADIIRKLDAIIDFAEIDEFIDTPVQYYSSGMKVRLGFAVASQMEPDVLIIDEVLAVGDAAFRVKCYNKIFELLPRTAVVFVSHSMPQISRVCNRILLLDRGMMSYHGNNLGMGIREYFIKLNFKTSKSVQGEGKAEITNVTLKDWQGISASEFNYLDKAVLCIDYKLLSEVASVSFLIVVRNDEQTAVAQIKSPEVMTNLASQSAIMSLTSTIDKIEFNPGRYTLTVSIVKGKSDELLYVCRDTCPFVVNGDELGYAPILMDLEWN